jgi:hypothetical protein
MAINMVGRRKGDYKDLRVERLREDGVPLLKRYGAVAPPLVVRCLGKCSRFRVGRPILTDAGFWLPV